MGASRTPPNAPSAPDSTNDNNKTDLVLIPTNSAASLLCEVASMALPCWVRPKNQPSATTTTAATPSTHRLCGSKVAPAIRKGFSPEKAASACVPLPSNTCTRPRTTREAPMVMMMRGTTSARPAGSMANFSIKAPTAPATTIASTIASGSGKPRPVNATAAMPPSMMNSPWAKLITPLEL